MNESPLEKHLRSALRSRADGVQPSGDALARIRGRRSPRPGRQWRPGLEAIPLAAGMGLLVAFGGLHLTVNRSPDAEVQVAARPTTPRLSSAPIVPPPSAASTVAAEPSATVAARVRPRREAQEAEAPVQWGSRAQRTAPRAALQPMPAPAGPITVPLYYVGTVSGRSVLYREFATMPGSADRVHAAVSALLSKPPVNPAYSTALPAGSRVRGYRREGTVGSLELSGLVPSRLALQQLVHTVTAVDPGATSLQVSVNGRPLGDPVQRAPDVDILAPVWVLADHRATVPRSYVLEGIVHGPFPTVRWEVRRGFDVVAQGSAAVADDGLRRVWDVPVDFPNAGNYVVRAWPEGNPAAADTVTVTAR